MNAEYQIGVDAVADKKYDQAREAWSAFLQNYPLDGRAADILYTLGEMALNEQAERVKADKDPNWNEPIALWRKVVNKYPNTESSGLPWAAP